MKSKLKKITYLVLSLLIALLLNNTLFFNNGAQTELSIPKQSAGYSKSFIHVDGNWSATTSYDWCYGDGSWGNPYIIENVTIDASGSPTGSGIFIDNSKNDYFIIRNCTVKYAGNAATDAGIKLYNTCNGTIFNNTVSNNDNEGIYLNFICNNNTISQNTANYNGDKGISLQSGCDNNNITENTINDNTDTGIYLFYSCDNNVIKNNTINRNDVGIVLYQCDNNNISGNILIDNSFCIYEYSCFGNIIEYNECSPPTVQEPISIDDATTGVGAHNWTWAVSQSWCSGSGTWNDPYIIENLKICGFGTGYGIYICNSNVSFIIQDCLIYNSNAGIYLEEVNNSRLINNNCSNMGEGIYIEYANNNTISGNTANGNNNEGIYLVEGDYNYITGNTVNDNDDGIRIDTSCDNNLIGGNIANDNERAGIYLAESDYNNITGNTASGNNNGIFLEFENSNNIITGNIFNNNDLGIEIYYSDFNSIIGNTANDNNNYGITIEESNNNTLSGNYVINNTIYGILLHEQSNNNTISGNRVNDNKDTGIYLDDDGDNNVITENTIYNNSLGIYLYSDCGNNSIYKNFFLKNGKHAFDDGTDNKWNSTIIGNYWDNWTTPDVSPNDGIVDLPYNISGPAGSIDYLPIAEDGAPSITINSPTSSDVFGVIAPSFDVTITDVYVDSMWYTIDGGINNYTFIENGIIHQSAWNAMPNGAITLTFYASDIINNIGIAEVTVVKDTIGPNIIINSPSSGSQFGVNAPAFIITIIDDHLDSIWYSLDGGLTTYVITTNATIDQTAWAALLEGSVTITIYANDTLGNEASEDVIITKSIPDETPDMGIIIIIVVVSVIGGVVLISVVYIYLKKRSTTA